jgi:hypothetical protein
MNYWRQPQIGILEIAIGVAFGVLAANIIEAVAIASYARFQLQLAVKEIQDSQRHERDRQQRAAQAAAQIREQRESQIKFQANQQRQAQQIAQAAELKKELAWKQFYHQPAECSNMANNDTFVKCSNDYIKARRKFEESYQP